MFSDFRNFHFFKKKSQLCYVFSHFRTIVQLRDKCHDFHLLISNVLASYISRVTKAYLVPDLLPSGVIGLELPTGDAAFKARVQLFLSSGWTQSGPTTSSYCSVSEPPFFIPWPSGFTWFAPPLLSSSTVFLETRKINPWFVPPHFPEPVFFWKHFKFRPLYFIHTQSYNLLISTHHNKNLPITSNSKIFNKNITPFPNKHHTITFQLFPKTHINFIIPFIIPPPYPPNTSSYPHTSNTHTSNSHITLQTQSPSSTNNNSTPTHHTFLHIFTQYHIHFIITSSYQLQFLSLTNNNNTSTYITPPQTHSHTHIHHHFKIHSIHNTTQINTPSHHHITSPNSTPIPPQII